MVLLESTRKKRYRYHFILQQVINKNSSAFLENEQEERKELIQLEFHSRNEEAFVLSLEVTKCP